MEKALDRIIDYAVCAARPEKIVLFGSFANGKNDIYSDVDLLVVTEHSYMKKELEARISSIAKEYSLNADILIHTPSEIEKAYKKPFSFLSSIISGGIIVYEKST